MKPQPEVVELDQQDLHAKLDLIERELGPQAAQPFRQLLAAYLTVLALLREKNISIQRLRKLIFGSSSEKSSNILPEEENSSEAVTDTAEAGEEADDEGPGAEQGSESTDLPGDSSSSTSTKKKPRRPGHGRTPACAYIGCTQQVVTHDHLCPGDDCPECGHGSTLYRQSEWSLVVRLRGQPPVGGTLYRLERLRCNLCGKVYTAELPKEAGPVKFDPTVSSIIATLRYGEGLPWNRIQRVQSSAGIPLPASIQWEVVRDAVPGGIEAAYDHLLKLGAQGELFHNDDTSAQVLALADKLKKQQPLLEEDPDRRGVYTTNILSVAQGRPTIALFFTGPHHAGENLRSVLAHRRQELPWPILMCDGLSRNMPQDLQVILANCLAHSRRKFVDVIDAFQLEVKYVIKCLKQVYKTDAEARKQQLSPEERLRLHQQHSQSVMDELHTWLKKQFDERRVEPNSSLGEAISYMLNHWDQLTLFLHVAGAPLDNNICEQALKMAIRHRRNSLFYKTMRGARVGDLYMSLIHTCYFSKADPMHYLTELQKNSDRVTEAPGDWMPWNYRQQLDPREPKPDSSRPPPGGGGLSKSL